MFMFTDNTVAERAYFKGYSKNRDLFELVYRLRMLTVRVGLQLHLVHISGKRMIDVGVDGLSRGQLSGGVMAGDTIFLHVPLHLAAPERSPGVTDWIQSWWPDEN